MSETFVCSQCGGTVLVGGHLIQGAESTETARFLPYHLDIRQFSSQWWGVALDTGFQACLQCGLVTSRVNAASLRSFLVDHGTELVRQQVDEFDAGPLRGLPDTATARQVVAGVAEIDYLVRLDQPRAAATRFQTLTGATWNQAVAATRNWRDLKREAKLAHFGWVQKKQATTDDLDDPWI